MRAKITKRVVDRLTPGGEPVFDTEVRGFIARRLKSGVVSYGFRYRAAGRRSWISLGLHGSITPDQARALAKKRAGEVADDRDPAAERRTVLTSSTHTVDAVLDRFLDRYVRKQDLRSADSIERIFARLVRPRIGGKPIYDLGRRDVVELLDAVEDQSGPVMADRTLAHLRKAFNWWATRDDKFSPPIVKGMARTKSKERARSRMLDDQEICDLWRALDELEAEGKVPTCFPGFVRVLLLTGQRRSDVSGMNSSEIADGVWVIPAERYKTKVENAVPLTEKVTHLIGERTGFIFSTDGGKRAFSGYSKAKRALDSKLAELRKGDKRKDVAGWTLHDLRRTARSLMSRAGVQSDVAERVLGHVIPGVRGVYDRHRYQQEKLAALESLAELVAKILVTESKAVALETDNQLIKPGPMSASVRKRPKCREPAK